MATAVALNNGHKMPIFGLGTYRAQGPAAVEAVKAAIRAGYRHVDTAAFYCNEKEVGEAIRECGVPREEIFVTTKMWYTEHGYESARKAFNDSYKKLGLEYIDLYLIHWPGTSNDSKENPKTRAETWRALEEIYAEGKVKAIGVSNYTIRHLQEMMNFKVRPAVNQVEFHPLLFQKDLMEFCNKNGVVLQAYSPLGKGKLLTQPVVVEVAKKYSKSPAQILIRWGLQHNVVEIPKSASEKRVSENADIFDFEISDEDMQKLNSLHCSWRCTWDPTDVL